jgi:hypothetical protein
VGHGTFSGEPAATWLTQDGTPDRLMKILQPFSFKDPDAKIWRAPKGAVIDGASIPRALWTAVGSPYTGDYRRASIVHDVACDEAGGSQKKRRAADRMFFHACRAGGCSIRQSIILYLGVRVGAAAIDVPPWHAAISIESAGPRTRRSDDELRLERDFQQITDRVLAQGETDDPRQLERRADAAFPVVLGLKKVKSRSVAARRKP